MVYILLHVENKIAAIKLFRALYPIGLREAKEAVEAAMAEPGLGLTFEQYGRLSARLWTLPAEVEAGFYLDVVRDVSPIKSLDGIVETVAKSQGSFELPKVTSFGNDDDY